jgi:hypothetical protein
MLAKPLVPVAALTLLASAALGAVTATAQAAPARGGTVHVVDYSDGEGVGSTVVLTGAIGDSGSADSIDANGTPDPSNNTEVELALVQGSFAISVVGLDKKIDAAFSKLSPNPNTCSGYVSVIGGAPIVAGSGTRAYAGISGGFTLGFTLALILPKYASGPHKGQCNFSNSAATVGQAQVVQGTGTVSFG